MSKVSFVEQFLPKAVGFGNRCGHTPDMPDLSLRFPANEGKVGKDGIRRGAIPKILGELLARLSQYYWKPSIIPSLNLANNSRRQQRSERREGCVKLLSALVKYLDLTTLKVGIPQKSGEFHGLTIPYLATHAGISFYRAGRAMRDLQKAGLVTLATRVEHDSQGGYHGVAAVKAVRQELFGIFGLVRRLKYERKSASKRQTVKKEAFEADQSTRKGSLGDLARLKAMIQGLMGEGQPKTAKATRGPVASAESLKEKEQKAKLARFRKLAKDQPELSEKELHTLLKNCMKNC